MDSALVLSNEALSKNIYLLTLHIDSQKASKFKPGQFLKILFDDQRLDPLIPRPYTVHTLSDNRLQILYQVVGKGTTALSKVIAGQVLRFLGPLGKPFPKDLPLPLGLCAGGVGVAGFSFLLQKLPPSHLKSVKLYYGAKTKEDLVRLELFESFGIDLELATEDGSLGNKGFVTDILEKDLKRQRISAVLACGPRGMLKRVKELAERHSIKAYLVMDTFLACGTGFCKGCVIPRKGGGFFHLCEDGPTLPAEQVDI